MWLFDEVRNVPDIIRYWASKTPNKIALIDGPATRTYAQLDQRSNGLANRMLKMGVQQGSNVGFYGKNAIEFFEVWFAASKIACAIAPLNWRSAAEELVALVNDAKPSLIFVSAEFLDAVQKISERTESKFEIVQFDQPGGPKDHLANWIEDCRWASVQAPLTGNDVALLTYTSGTTGRPKGVQATHEAFQYSFLGTSLEPTLNLSGNDTMLMAMPNFHLAGSWVCLGALYYGGTVTIIPAFELQAFLTSLRRDRPTVVPLVPAAIQLLLNRPDFLQDDYSSIRSILYFGSPIGRELLNLALAKLRCELNQYYGTTGTWFLTVLNHKQHLSGGEGRLASCGLPLPLVSMKIVDADDDEVPNGTVGEILVRTPMAFAGYFKQPDVTASVLTDGWYRTGDLGRRDDEGFYYLVDRAKDMIITGGENVYSAEVEGALLKHPAVATIAVIGTADPKWGEKVTALVVLSANVKVDEGELKQHCRKYLAGYKIPKEILFENSLPMTPTGKVQKAVLRQRFRN